MLCTLVSKGTCERAPEHLPSLIPDGNPALLETLQIEGSQLKICEAATTFMKLIWNAYDSAALNILSEDGEIKTASFILADYGNCFSQLYDECASQIHGLQKTHWGPIRQLEKQGLQVEIRKLGISRSLQIDWEIDPARIGASFPQGKRFLMAYSFQVDNQNYMYLKTESTLAFSMAHIMNRGQKGSSEGNATFRENDSDTRNCSGAVVTGSEMVSHTITRDVLGCALLGSVPIQGCTVCFALAPCARSSTSA